MALYKVQCIVPYFTNVPEDVSSNTLWFQSVEPATQAEAITAILAKVVPAYQAWDSWYSPVCLNQLRVKIYAMADPEPRKPISESQHTLSVSTGQGAPEECAIVLSYQAAKVSGGNQARRRGRIYLGPFAKSAFQDATTSAFSRVNSATITSIFTGVDILKSLTIGDDVVWSVFSPTDNQAHFVADGWIDLSPDTQRRRGGRTTGRSTFVV
jgi:hypothetical protein